MVTRKYGTPTYVYDGDVALAKLAEVRHAFKGIEILFAFKANPNPGLLRVFAHAGVGADVASMGELRLALKAGFRPRDIVLGGPGKPASELEEAVRVGVGAINVESDREIRLLADIGRRQGSKARVIIRVNTRHRPPIAGELMAGGASRFGIDEEVVSKRLGRLKSRFVEYLGIHAHVASQVLDANSLIAHYGKLAKIAKNISAQLGFPLKVLNFGGGLGVPYGPKEHHLDLRKLGSRTSAVLASAFPATTCRPRFQLELGRYLVAECGLFLTEVLEVKCSRGKRFVITDSGINGLARPAMPWAQQHPCTLLARRKRSPTQRCVVVGRTCLPSDVLCQSARLPTPRPRDVIVVRNCGAYGYTMSMVLWASLTPPTEVLIARGKVVEVRAGLCQSGGDGAS
ncbi:hypothetical protein ACFL2T_00655 [Elusimicrobiota bacterium]